MKLKEKTRKELEDKVEKLENLIARKGIGSDYLGKAERIQRDLNIAVILGTTTLILGITALAVYKFKGE